MIPTETPVRLVPRYPKAPAPAPNQEKQVPRVLDASNPFHRIEDREANLLRRLKTR